MARGRATFRPLKITHTRADDAAQLIKHGLRVADQPTRLVALVLGLPRDAGLSPLFAEHRREIDALAERVAGAMAFEALSYFEL